MYLATHVAFNSAIIAMYIAMHAYTFSNGEYIVGLCDNNDNAIMAIKLISCC